MFTFISGVIVVQLGTLALYYGATQAGLENTQLVAALVLLELLFAVLMGFWFSSMAVQRHRKALDALKEEHARERERIKINAERQKARVISTTHKQLLRETRRAHAAANFKVGAAFVGALAFGAVMLYSQFVTLGLLVLTTAGGGLAGYLARGRQPDRQAGRTEQLPGQGNKKLPPGSRAGKNRPTP